MTKNQLVNLISQSQKPEGEQLVVCDYGFSFSPEGRDLVDWKEG